MGLLALPCHAVDAAAASDLERLQQRAARLFDQRKQAIAALATAGEVEAYRAARRDYLHRELGPWPERTPLRARTVGHVERDGIRVERVIYESRPGFCITGLVFLPAAPGRYPGVLVSCGHEPESKAAEFNQQPAILLARNGFIALSFDPIGQWERTQVAGPMRPAQQHQILGIGCSLVGTPLAHAMVWDAMRSLDYLQSRPDVDPERIGATGYSGGGNLTALLMALDDRVSCAVPAVFLSSLPRLVFHYGAQDAEATFFGQIPAGFGHSDYVALRAPKPTLFCAATRDNSGIEGTRETFAEARRIFRVLGADERVAMVETEGGHGYHPPLREAMAGWMTRWLKGPEVAINETPVKSFAMDELQCTEGGNVAALPGARTLFEINAAEADGWSAQRARQWREDPASAIAQVRQHAGVPLLEKIARRRAAPGKTPALVTEDAASIPMRMREPSGPPTGASLVIHGSDDGDRERAHTLAEREIAQGRTVLLAEIIGTGSRHDRQTRHRNFLEALGSNFEAASLAYKLGTPFLGLRAGEILACALFLQQAGNERIDLLAVGEIVPAALHAAALEPQLFRSLVLRGGLESWRPLLAAATAPGRYADVVPGALRCYDLPDLAEHAAARGVTITRVSLSAATIPAAETHPATHISTRGKLLFHEDFSGPFESTPSAQLSQERRLWRTAHGKWESAGGALRGAQIKGRKSGNALRYVAFKDAVIQFEVQLNGCKMAQFIVNDTQPGRSTGEHICRVALNQDGFRAQKDDHDHAGPDAAVPFGEIKLPIAPGEWKTVLVEIRGNELAATIDGRTVRGADPLLATEKSLVGFVVTGESASFRNLRIWEALPNKDQPAHQSKPARDHR